MVLVGSAHLLSHCVALSALTLNQRVQGSSPCAPTIELQSLAVDGQRYEGRSFDSSLPSLTAPRRGNENRAGYPL